MYAVTTFHSLFKMDFPTDLELFQVEVSGQRLSISMYFMSKFFKGKKICELLSNNEINLESTPCPQSGSQRGDRVVINRPGSGFTPLFNLPELVRNRYLKSPITTQRRLWADTARYSRGVAHRHCRPTLLRLSAGLHSHGWP